MSARRYLASVFALSLMLAGSGAGFAQERSVGDGGRSGPRIESSPSAGAVPAGSPFVGPDRVTRAEVRATGAEYLTISGPAPLSELVAAELGSAEGRESVIGWNSMIRVNTTRYPARAIGLITVNGAHHCTGWLISRNTVATAGHCVHTGGSSGSWYQASTMRFWPGRDGTDAPYGSCTVAWLRSVTGWTVNDDSLYDYGAMRLNCNIGDTTGWFGVYSGSASASAGFWQNQPAIISGYPGSEAQFQMLSADRIRMSEALRVCYRMDTVGGHSGSPIWNDRNAALYGTGAWAFAVHAYGLSTCGTVTDVNWGPRLTGVRVNNYAYWISVP